MFPFRGKMGSQVAGQWIPRFTGVVLASIGVVGIGQASERIRYDEIPNHLAPFGNVLAYRSFNVITLNGKKHSGRRLRLESDHVRVFHLDNSWEDLFSEQIARIEIRQSGRFFHHIVDSAELPVVAAALGCGDVAGYNVSTACLLTAIALFSPVWAYTAVAAPFYLASDGVAFFVRPKIYDIVH